jgi:hypothetical protein
MAFYPLKDEHTGLEMTGIAWQEVGTGDLYVSAAILFGLGLGNQNGTPGSKTDNAGLLIAQAKMKTGVVNSAKVIGLANRIRIAPNSERQKLIAELLSEIDSGSEIPTRKPQGASNETALRDMLQWPEIRSSPVASLRIARMLITERDK